MRTSITVVLVILLIGICDIINVSNGYLFFPSSKDELSIIKMIIFYNSLIDVDTICDNFCFISVERMNNQNRWSTKKSEIQDLMALGHPNTEKIMERRDIGIAPLRKGSKTVTKKRRNHWLDHLSSFYYPTIPRQYIKRSKSKN